MAHAFWPIPIARPKTRIVTAGAMRYVADAVWEIFARHKNTKHTKAKRFVEVIQTLTWLCFVCFFKTVIIVFSVQAHWGKSLTLAGHAYWLIAGLAHAVVDGGAAGLRGVLGVRTGQAGTRAPWSSLRFIGSRWTCCGGRRRPRFLSKKDRKKLESRHLL